MKNLFRDKDKESCVWAWGCFSIGLMIIFWLFGTGCSHNVPAIDVTFWAGDSAHSGISRSQESKTISCTDGLFDDYACLTYRDVQKIYATMLTCKNWGASLASQKEFNQMASKNHEVIDNVIQTSAISSKFIQP